MQLLNFDEVNKYQTFREWLTSMKPSELMDKKKEVRERVGDLLEFAYMLGYTSASEELGVIADDVAEFLPKDYMDEREKEVYRKFDDKDFSERVTEYAEMGDASNILRVAETDGNRVYNAGGLLGAKGKAKTKTWNTMEDDRVRDTHDYLEQMTVPIDGEFYTYDGDHARYPGDFTKPQNSINCRCFLTFDK